MPNKTVSAINGKVFSFALLPVLTFMLLIAIVMSGCVPAASPSSEPDGNSSTTIPPANSAMGTTIYRAFPNSWSQLPVDEQDLLSEIKLFPFNWSLTKYLKCDGAILPISSYGALFPLLGNKFGGDGKSNFAIPNLTQITPNGLNYYLSTNGPWPGQNAQPANGELQYCQQESWNTRGDHYLGEILLAAEVSEWDTEWIVPCDGRTLPVNQNQALFALVGGAFGGDGTTTFALPNLTEVKSPVEEAQYHIVTMGIFPSRGSNEIPTPPKYSDQYQVIRNNFDSYSVWPIEKEIPIGWKPINIVGTREECMKYVNDHSPS